MSDIQLYIGDCLEVMKDIPEHSVDMVLCDLPYGTTSCSWDSIIPFEPLWEQYHRVCKEYAPIVLFGSQPFTTIMISSNIKEFREEIIWLKNKSGSGMQHKQKHIKVHENIEIFSKHGKYTYNPQMWNITDKKFITYRKTFKTDEFVGNTIYGSTHRTRKVDTGERNPISIVSYEVPFTPQKSSKYDSSVDLRLHPTQKPIELCEYLIKTYSNDNDTVLDNCMGSGTTGAACIHTGRNFIGIEKEEKYFEIAKKRIDDERKSFALWE